MGLWKSIKKGVKSIGKGVKKVFSKIGKGIKSAFKSVGKFMGKLGIVGQIGLGLLLPGIGQFLGTWAGTAMASSNALIAGAGQFVNAAVNIGTKVGSVFKSVTEGVTQVIGETVGATLNKIPGMDKVLNTVSGGKINITDKTFKTAFETAGTAISDVASSGKSLFSMDTLTGTNKFTQQVIDDNMAKMSKITEVPDISVPEPDFSQAIPEDVGLTNAPESFSSSLTGTDLPPGQSSIVNPQKSLLDLQDAVPEGFDTTVTTPKPVASLTQPVLDLQDVVPKGFDSNLTSVEMGLEKTFAEKAMAEGKSFLSDTYADAKAGAKTQILQSVGLEDEQVYEDNRVSYGTYIPEFNMAQADIRMGRGMEFDPRAYESNKTFFNSNPYGNSAQQHNEYQMYLNRMAQVA
tara:strand:- start:1519 stop:2730 length:1212 start_codon:yes stop_codon:yes gene_type:complete